MRELAELFAPLGIECHLGEKPRTGRTRRDRRQLRRECRAQGRSGRAAASGMMAIADDSGLVVAALEGAPGISFGALGRTREGFRSRHAARATRAARRAARTTARAKFVCALARCLARARDPHLRGQGRSARWSGRRAGRAASATIQSSCRTATSETFGEMDPAKKNAMSPPRARLRKADRRTMTDQCSESLRRLCALAVLPGQMPLLRLQHPCPRTAASTRRASSPPICASSRTGASLDARPRASPASSSAAARPR